MNTYLHTIHTKTRALEGKERTPPPSALSLQEWHEPGDSVSPQAVWGWAIHFKTLLDKFVVITSADLWHSCLCGAYICDVSLSFVLLPLSFSPEGVSPSAWVLQLSVWSQQPKTPPLPFCFCICPVRQSAFWVMHLWEAHCKSPLSGWVSLYLRAELKGDSSLQGKIAFPISTLNVPLPAEARRCCPLNIFHPIVCRQPEFLVYMSTTET